MQYAFVFFPLSPFRVMYFSYKLTQVAPHQAGRAQLTMPATSADL